MYDCLLYRNGEWKFNAVPFSSFDDLFSVIKIFIILIYLLGPRPRTTGSMSKMIYPRMGLENVFRFEDLYLAVRMRTS